MTVDLPLVGELVQITTSNGVELATLDSRWWFRHPDGHTTDPKYVQSWCRVLVVSDTEETVETMAAAAWDSDPERVRIDMPWSEQDGAIRADWLAEMRAALAAVRGAAIR